MDTLAASAVSIPVPDVPASSAVSARAANDSLADSTTFSPYAHSWILVPEIVDPSEGSSTTTPKEAGVAALATGPGDASGVPFTISPTAKSGPPSRLPSPHLSGSILGKEGEAVAGLAVSEILSSQCVLPASLAHVPNVALSDATLDTPPGAPESAGRKRPANHSPPMIRGKKAAAMDDGVPQQYPPADDLEDDDGILLDLGVWGRPLTIAAVLLVSHAAAVLIGVALGQRQSSSPSGSAPSVDTAQLSRSRYSSNASGVHARFCDRMA